MKREFLQLAHTYNPKKHYLNGWCLSEKLNGQRCFWDGGVSRSHHKSDVPWANTKKDSRYIFQQFATGLWSRYGNIIHAPDKWLDTLPKIPLDGELWLGRPDSARQELRSIISKINPIWEDWQRVVFMCFRMPSLRTILADGIINNTNFHKHIHSGKCIEFISNYKFDLDVSPWWNLKKQDYMLKKHCKGFAISHNQLPLPMQSSAIQPIIQQQLDDITTKGGEGLIISNPSETYECGRSHQMVKIKKLDDMEAVVMGYKTGKLTDKGSRHLGRMGALLVRLDSGVELLLSGFDDNERELFTLPPYQHLEAKNWAANNPDSFVPTWIHSCNFPRGGTITFRYRGMSRDSVPQEARYWRKWVVE